jgi:hypothetical protein
MDINDIRISDIKRVYSGRPGCGCGCRGKYYDAGHNMVKRVYRILSKSPDTKCHPADGIFYLENEKRYYWIYLKEGIV